MADKKLTLKKAEKIAEKVIEKTEGGAKKVVEKAGKVIKKTEEMGKEVIESVRDAIENKKSKKKNKESKPEESENKKLKLEELKKKAKKLASSVKEAKEIDLKKEIKPEDKEKKDALVPIDDYLKSSIHLGTKVITPDMKSFVYRRRADGLAVFNTALLDDMIRAGANFLAKYLPNEVVIVCKRESGWKAVNKFSEITGIKAYTKKYPAGILIDFTFFCFM